MSADLSAIAEHLLDAQDHQHTAEQPSATNELSAEDAYAVQEELITRRLKRGEVIVGLKLGLTSKAKQEAMGVREPIFGVLTDAMQLKEGEPVPLTELIHARVEPEIVYVLKDALKGPGVTKADVIAATGSVHVGLEVIDSRYADFSFTHADVVSDNTSAARFVLSERSLPTDCDLVAIPVTLEVDGEVKEQATGAAVMGDPTEAVALLANWLGARGRQLDADSIVLSGGMTNAHGLKAGSTIRAVFGDFDSISVSA